MKFPLESAATCGASAGIGPEVSISVVLQTPLSPLLAQILDVTVSDCTQTVMTVPVEPTAVRGAEDVLEPVSIREAALQTSPEPAAFPTVKRHSPTIAAKCTNIRDTIFELLFMRSPLIETCVFRGFLS